MRLSTILSAHLAVFGATAVISASCKVEYGYAAFRCNPGIPGPCPDGYICCSDDPAAWNIKDNDNDEYLPHFGVTTDFANMIDKNRGIPMFAGVNNSISRVGMCIEEGTFDALAGQTAFAVETNVFGCPIPCNPGWAQSAVDVVCGAGAVCCQSAPLQADDCIVDTQTGCWRPATVDDFDPAYVPTMVDATGKPIPTGTNWAANAHSTHQDPGIDATKGACATFFQNWYGNPNDQADVISSCVKHLSVGHERGFCFPATSVPACPPAPGIQGIPGQGTPNACDELNQKDPLLAAQCTTLTSLKPGDVTHIDPEKGKTSGSSDDTGMPGTESGEDDGGMETTGEDPETSGDDGGADTEAMETDDGGEGMETGDGETSGGMETGGTESGTGG